MGINPVAAVYLYLRNQERRRNYEEWEERMLNNISRWESSLQKLKDAISRTEENIQRNTEKLEKAEKFLASLKSEKTKDWYSRTLEFISVSTNPKKVADAQSKIDEHDEKKRSCKE